MCIFENVIRCLSMLALGQLLGPARGLAREPASPATVMLALRHRCSPLAARTHCQEPAHSDLKLSGETGLQE